MGSNFLPNEREAIQEVIAHAKNFGYGNLIDRLKIGWALHLMETTSLSISTIESASRLDAGRLSGKREDVIKAIKYYIGD